MPIVGGVIGTVIGSVTGAIGCSKLSMKLYDKVDTRIRRNRLMAQVKEKEEAMKANGQ